MPEMPAFCDTCGTVFGSTMFFENCREVSLSGIKVGPCPKCGGQGHIPDGVFDFTEDAIKVLVGTKRTVKELAKLAAILSKARQENRTKEQVEQAIQEQLPELSSLASFLPKTRTELYAFINILFVALSLMITTGIALQDDAPSEAEIQKMIDLTVEKAMQKPASEGPPSLSIAKVPQEKKAKVGRNDPCPCGSGKKHKKCCL